MAKIVAEPRLLLLPLVRCGKAVSAGLAEAIAAMLDGLIVTLRVAASYGSDVVARVRIPIAEGVESLNVSVAVAIVLFESVRRGRALGSSVPAP